MTRVVLAVLVMLLASSQALPQQDKVHRLGALFVGSGSIFRNVTVAELAKHGFVDGRNLLIETRAGSPEEMPRLAEELVALNPDVIVAVGPEAIASAMAATKTIPIVMHGADAILRDPAVRMSRPAGNATGLAIMGAELDVKRLELLREALPGARRIGALVHPSTSSFVARQEEMRSAAARMDVELMFFAAPTLEAYSAAFAAMRATGIEGLAIASHPQFARDGSHLAQLSAEAGLPTICQWREMAEQGCVLAYGPSLAALYQRVAQYVARILKGASPAELPIEMPTRFEFTVNVRATKMLGLSLSQSLLGRADELIE